ncbi:hypothetical protein H072_2920 [Dactylellina haptotyla CBS 200.50]|uniref:RING-type domain-containing protein n=1 Tax=Dactylellina haptotyla (strain CBS 200.50) TaxID=1284197 RepID=S8BUJ0_DACHA|nr:hypothetical protein H072_2920 [Dactylellina haptotyla CBS 200.50]
MPRSVETTVFTAPSVSLHAVATEQRPARSKPPSKKRTSIEDPIDLAEDSDSDSPPAYLTLWRHRIKLVLRNNDVQAVHNHLRASLPNPSHKTTVDAAVQRPASANTVLAAWLPGEDGAHLFSAFLPADSDHLTLYQLISRLHRNRKMKEDFLVSWSILPETISPSSSSVTLELEVKRRDTWVIDWKAEKWLSSFLALITDDSGAVVSLSTLKHAVNTTASAKGDIQARDFYESVFVPPADAQVPTMIQVSELTTQMFPFQMRTVNWMMEREGVTAADGSIRPLPVAPPPQSLCIQETEDYDGTKMWMSIPLALTTSNHEEVQKLAQLFQVKGGILAEEMGLGKTVELISLLSLHKREIPPGQETIFDAYSGADVRASGSTLIICPPSIMQQWVNELNLHAPGLRVLKYNGTRELVQMVYQKKNALKGRVSNEKYMEMSFVLQGIPNAELVEHLLQYDIVLSSYNVLANELHYAERPPDRALRHEKKYERRSCPLVDMSWWRVCLDEAQMIENGVSNAAQVARLIPRVNAWAVTGTPVQRSIEDLYGLLVFLRQDPWCGNKTTWEKLCFRKEWFGGVFKQLALRHTKDIVHEEIKLPRQHRTAISLGFSQVEEENYQRLFEQACKDIEVALDGSPLGGHWNPESEETRARMRTWLGRLRQTCVHPQVGAWNRRALGTGAGPLRTVAEVLEAMIQQNTTIWKQDQRMMFVLIAARAQIVLEASKKPQEAIEMLQEYLGTLETAVEECRKDVEEETKARALEKEARKEKAQEKQAHAAERSMHSPDTAEDEYTDQDDRMKETWEESDDEDDAGEEGTGSASELNKLKNRLRDIVEVQHIFHFYLGGAYFNLKDAIPEDDEQRQEERAELGKLEDKHYEIAKELRKELMSEPENNVTKLIAAIERRTARQDFVIIPEFDVKDQKGGIESSAIMEDIQLLAEKLDEQAEVLDEWRENLIQLLQMPLIDQEQTAELEGDELQQSAEQQDEGFLYVALLRTVIADRAQALTGITSGLASAEMKTAAQRAETQDEKHQELFQDLKSRRDDVKPLIVDDNIDAGTTAMPFSMRGLVAKLRKIANTAREGVASGSRSKVEAGLVQETLKKLTPLLAQQDKALKGLEKEIGFLADLFNARVEFYRQLQVVSDMVQQFDEEKALKANSVRALDVLEAKYTTEIKDLSNRVGKTKSKGRFLQHLKETQGESQRMCIICQEAVQLGVLTVCGHQFCKECMEMWYRAHHTCPVCKKQLRRVDFHPVTYRVEDVRIEKEVKTFSAGSSAAGDKGIEIYTGMDVDTFNQIKKIPLHSSFGSKIDMVIRHLLWIRRHNGGKSVVFSQWKEVLDVFQRALEGNGIGFSSLEEKKGLNRFKTDEKVEVFLLHAKSQSAGLTLVTASNVFLVEPLVNTGLEVQAIARVHRIGQKRETNVFMYVIGGTVEEGVWRNATKRRVEMLEGGEGSPKKRRKVSESDRKGKGRALNVAEEINSGDLEMQLETVNSLQLQQGTVLSMIERAPGGGEIVDNEQLWSCLFGVTRKDRTVELAETRREMVASAREEGRGNVVDDSAIYSGSATLNLQWRVRVADDNGASPGRRNKRARME